MKNFGLFKICLLVLLFSAELSAMSRRPLYVTPSDKYHIVQPGDTLYRISQKSGVSVTDLKLYNNLDSDTIEVGQKVYYAPRDPGKKMSYITERPIPENSKHIVKKGETLAIIARIYNVDLLELLHYNKISTWELKEGQIINLAGGMQPETTVVRAESKTKDKPVKKDKPASIPQKIVKKIQEKARKLKPDDFTSPLNEYRISQHFNKDERHQGIDLAAPAGTPIYAVQNGIVIYAGTQKGYGNLIIIEHKGRVMTVYAHNEKNIAIAGEKVKRGDQIATVGNTGRSTGNHLHFEIRQEGIAVDPAPFITKIGR